MKKTILLLAAWAVLAACGNPQKPLNPLIPDDPDQPVVVPPAISPDSVFVAVSSRFAFGEEPLKSKADGRDGLYVVGIHQIIPTVSLVGNHYSRYANFAFGVFDDLGLAVFKLAKKFHYGICVAYLPDGKNQLKTYQDGFYGVPCRSLYATSGSPAHTVCGLNQIVYGYDTPDLEWGFAEAKGTDNLLWNTVERYQGYVDDWDPAQGDQLEIELYRMMMGMRITVTDFTKGRLEIYGEENFSIRYSLVPDASGSAELDLVMETPWMPFYGQALGSYDEFWDLDGMTASDLEEIRQQRINYGQSDVNIKYYDEQGQELVVYARTGMQLKRNTRYTLSFSMSEAIANQGIKTKVLENDPEMEDIPLE